MPLFELEHGGKTYEVDAPDQESAVAGFQKYAVKDVDIGKVLFGGGATAAPAKEGFDAADVAKSAGVGAAKGAIGLGGLSGDLRELAASGASKLTGVPAEKFSGAIRYLPLMGGPTSEQIRSGVEGVTGKFYEPQTTAGEYAQTAGEFLPAAIGGGGGLAARAARVALPAAASETAGQATQGTEAEPYARAAAGLATPVAMAGVRRAISPVGIQPGRQAMVNTLEQEGITPTAGQRSGSKALQYVESTLGDYPGAGGQATAAAERSGQQFTRAALRRIGLEGDEITPAAVDRAVGNIQNEFTRLSSSTTMRLDRGLAQDIGRVLNRYDRKLPSQQREVINNIADDILANGQTMPGNVYQTARSDLSRMAHAARHNDPTLSDALRGLRDALDTAMRRSISPQDRAAWDQARRRWGNWRTLESAAKNTDEAGNVRITPQQLVQAAASRDRGSFARGLGDFNALARAGQSVLRPMPQSGTTPRAIAAGVLPALLSPAGFLPALGGVVAPPLAGRALMSGPMQRYLSNQAMGPGQTGRNIIGAAPGSLLQLQ